MLKVVGALALLAGFSAPALADFTLDLTPGEIRKASGETIVREMLVGDEAAIYASICHEGQKAFIDGDMPLLTRNKGTGHKLKAKKMPGGSFEVSIIKGEDILETEQEFIISLLRRGRDYPCPNFSEDAGRYFPITAFNGVNSASELIGQAQQKNTD
ncbi:hypothetical protein [Pseudogemmobacter faecipullorum]|uniref:Uncharacterized protein n=1 Tax=Pseudogemmobacter faecipullorum TaxID=2755041 RepID=A0ABS8CS71_9RHOB|nr:hypothetical protein [Pseudogemmobacter faecipullorum]MCB5412248.1 hypothetical protein [Pseudogemmobacter faecipullorum]